MEFNALYDSLLAGELGQLELQRKQFNQSVWRVAFFAIAAIVACGILAVVFNGSGPAAFIVLIVVVIVSAVILGVKYSRFAKPFRAAFKAKVIPDLVQFVDERLRYHPQ